MKFKCEVELDWIHDEDNLDSAVTRGIVKSVLDTISADVKKNIQSMVNDELASKIDGTIDGILKDFLNRPITITDSYGDVKESYTDVTDMLKTKFDDFMLEKVDSNGKTLAKSKHCSYDDKPRIERFLSEIADKASDKIKSQTDRFASDILNQVDRKIKKQLDESLREKVSETLVKKINLDSVLA